MSDSTFLTRVVLKNFKSIAACDVRLGPLMFIVGPNGAGKSNFLDALQFVADALRAGLDDAVRARGGFNELCFRGTREDQVAFRLEFRLSDGRPGLYAFSFGSSGNAGLTVKEEHLMVRDPERDGWQAALHRSEGGMLSIFPMWDPAASRLLPATQSDRLHLSGLGVLRQFAEPLDALLGIRTYQFDLGGMRSLQPVNGATPLLPDGRNVAAVLHHLSPERRARTFDYLRAIIPSLLSLNVETLLDQAVVGFTQSVAGEEHRFLAPAMSEGTLRALGILVALLQPDGSSPRGLCLIGLEEPEHALHPGALEVLLEALHEGSAGKQIVVTTHSADLLENKEVGTEELLVVDAVDGVSRLGPVDEASRTVVLDRLFTPGELLRMGALEWNGDSRAAQVSDETLFSLELR